MTSPHDEVLQTVRTGSSGSCAYDASKDTAEESVMEDTVPILHVADARASIDWYARLGFEVEWEHVFEPGMPLYVSLRRGSARLHLSEHSGDGGRASHVYLYVQDVDSIDRAGVVPEDRPWGMREAVLTDPDGHVVRVGSPLRDGEAEAAV